MPEGESLTRDEIAPVFPDNAVVVIHVSGHGGVLNSAALSKYRISADTPTPPVGVIARKPGSHEPTGRRSIQRSSR